MTDLSKLPVLIDVNVIGDLLNLFDDPTKLLNAIFSDGRKLYLPSELRAELDNSGFGSSARKLLNWAKDNGSKQA